MEIYKTTIFK